MERNIDQVESLAKLEDVISNLLQDNGLHSIKAEQTILGSILIQNAILIKLIDILGEDDFYSTAHKDIYAACLELYFRRSIAVDLVTLSEQLRKMGKLDEVGGPVYLAELASATVSTFNAVHHTNIMRDMSVQRRLIISASGIISNVIKGAENTGALLDAAKQSIFTIVDSTKTVPLSSSKELVDAVFEQLTKRVENKDLTTGVPTGYHSFDEYTAGLQPSDLIIVAGRPSMGKAAFVMNLAMRAACLYAVPTAIFSLEMSKEQVMARMLCSWSKVDLSKLLNDLHSDDDWAKFYESANVLAPAPIFIDDNAVLISELRARCRRMKAEHCLGLVVVDCLQLLRPACKRDSREQELADIARDLKALAKEMHVPVIVLSQLNSNEGERSGKRPTIHDLRESGISELDADVVVFVHRDETLETNGNRASEEILAEILIAKNRRGPKVTVKLRFFRESGSFENPEVTASRRDSKHGVQGKGQRAREQRLTLTNHSKPDERRNS